MEVGTAHLLVDEDDPFGIVLLRDVILRPHIETHQLAPRFTDRKQSVHRKKPTPILEIHRQLPAFSMHGIENGKLFRAQLLNITHGDSLKLTHDGLTRRATARIATPGSNLIIRKLLLAQFDGLHRTLRRIHITRNNLFCHSATFNVNILTVQWPVAHSNTYREEIHEPHKKKPGRLHKQREDGPGSSHVAGQKGT